MAASLTQSQVAALNERLLRRALKNIDNALEDAINDIGKAVANKAKRSIKASKDASKPGEPPHSKSGMLKKSINWARRPTVFSSRSKVVRVGSDLIYSLIQERGGTIRAKGKGYLVFPVMTGSQLNRRAMAKVKVFGSSNLVTAKQPRSKRVYRLNRQNRLEAKKLTIRTPGAIRGARRGKIYKWIKTKSVYLPRRPYLRPALKDSKKLARRILKRHFFLLRGRKIPVGTT
jgi:hypothetical protein